MAEVEVTTSSMVTRKKTKLVWGTFYSHGRREIRLKFVWVSGTFYRFHACTIMHFTGAKNLMCCQIVYALAVHGMQLLEAVATIGWDAWIEVWHRKNFKPEIFAISIDTLIKCKAKEIVEEGSYKKPTNERKNGRRRKGVDVLGTNFNWETFVTTRSILWFCPAVNWFQVALNVVGRCFMGNLGSFSSSPYALFLLSGWRNCVRIFVFHFQHSWKFFFLFAGCMRVWMSDSVLTHKSQNLLRRKLI